MEPNFFLFCYHVKGLLENEKCVSIWETSLRETNEASTINMSRECRVPLMY